MWRLVLFVFTCALVGANEDEAPEQEPGEHKNTIQVGSLNKLGHIVFPSNDGHAYEFSDEDAIGAGAWAKVFKARRLGNASQQIAIKYTLFASPHMGGSEIDVLRALGQFRGAYKNMVGMQFHNAKTLKHILENGDLNRHQLDILCALSEWRVHEFHARTGFIHRDLKPDNIMITENLEIILIDFSLAEPIVSQSDNRAEIVNLMEVDVQRPCFEIRKFFNEEYRDDAHAHILINGRKLPVSMQQANATYSRLLRGKSFQEKIRLEEQWSAKRRELDAALYLE